MKALLVTAEGRVIWPFPSVNGERTPESVALVTAKQPAPLTQYEVVMSDPETEDAPL